MSIARWKTEEEMTMSELAQVVGARARGAELPRFERDEYQQVRRMALDAAGLEAEDDDDQVSLDEMTVEQHSRRKQRAQR